eukprot:6175932-Pleurochrysis_carterae.AAC.1
MGKCLSFTRPRNRTSQNWQTDSNPASCFDPADEASSVVTADERGSTHRRPGGENGRLTSGLNIYAACWQHVRLSDADFCHWPGAAVCNCMHAVTESNCQQLTFANFLRFKRHGSIHGIEINNKLSTPLSRGRLHVPRAKVRRYLSVVNEKLLAGLDVLNRLKQPRGGRKRGTRVARRVSIRERKAFLAPAGCSVPAKPGYSNAAVSS